MEDIEENDTELSVNGEGEELSSTSREFNFEDYIKFPLPPHKDESLCRDEFLQRLFAPLQFHMKTSSGWTKSTERTSRARATLGAAGTMEAYAIMRRLQTNAAAAADDYSHDDHSEVVVVPKKQLTSLEKQIIHKFFMVRFQHAAVEYLAVRLKKRLEIFSNIWSAETTKIPHNLFKWSSSYFMARTNVNQLYLDVLAIEKDSTELNRNKFCTDVNEIIEILDLIRDDVRNDRDLCTSSLKLMDEMNYDVSAKWIKELARNRRVKTRLASSTVQKHDTRDRELRESIRFSIDKIHDATLPIEKRYRINWMNSLGDQYIMRIQAKENALQKELDEVKQLIDENALAFDSREFVYQMEIDRYRISIAKWEEQLEVELEELQLRSNVTRNTLAKAREDLKFYTERMEMFKLKVAEVLQMELDEEGFGSSRKRRRSTKQLAMTPTKGKKPKKKVEIVINDKKKKKK